MTLTATTPDAWNAYRGAQRRRFYSYPVETPALPVRKGTRVLSVLGDFAGVGTVEGLSYLGGESAHVVRWANGVVDTWETAVPLLVAVDAGTTLVQDQWNNVGRHCSVSGDGPVGEPCRVWRVVAAVSGGRYLVAHETRDEVRVVEHRSMTNLY